MKGVAAILGIAFLAGCGGSGDSTAPVDPSQAAVGNYALTQVNGGPLPATFFQNSAGRVEYTSGSMALRPDLSFTETRNSRIVYTDGTMSPNSAAVDNGTFTVVGSQVTFTIPAQGSSAAFSYTGAFSAGVVTYTFDGIAYRYQR